MGTIAKQEKEEVELNILTKVQILIEEGRNNQKESSIKVGGHKPRRK